MGSRNLFFDCFDISVRKADGGQRAAVRTSGVMIPGPESIPEPELHTFSEIDDSDSNSDSRKKWNHNTYRGVMIP